MTTASERFLRYVEFETTSDEFSETCPSTESQRAFGAYLLEEMKAVLEIYPELTDLVHTIEELPNISDTLVPKDSLLREFIGGSELAY